MARRRRVSNAKKSAHTHLKVLVLSVLMFSYLVQPYIPREQEPTFAHTYYKNLFEMAYDSLVSGVVYAQVPDPIALLEDTTNTNLPGGPGEVCVDTIQKLHLTWNENGNPSGTRYNIYRTQDNGGSARTIQDVTGSSYTDDQNLLPDRLARYTIKSENNDNPPVENPQGTYGEKYTLPNAPANLRPVFYSNIPSNPMVNLDWDSCGNDESTTTGTRYSLRSSLVDPDGNALPDHIVEFIQGSSLVTGSIGNNGLFIPNANYKTTIKAASRDATPQYTSATNPTEFWSPVNKPTTPLASSSLGAIDFSWYLNSNLKGTKYIVCRSGGPLGGSGFKCLSPVQNLGVPLGNCPSAGNDPAQIQLALQTCLANTPRDPLAQSNVYRDATVTGTGSGYSYKVMAISGACELTGSSLTPQEGCFITEHTSPVTASASSNAIYLDTDTDWTIATRVAPAIIQTSALTGTTSYYGSVQSDNGALGLAPNPTGIPVGTVTGGNYLKSGSAVYTFQTPSPVYWKNFLKHSNPGTGSIQLEWCATNTPTQSVCLGSNWQTVNGAEGTTTNLPFAGTANKYLLLRVTLSGDGSSTPLLKDVRVEYSLTP